MSSSLAYTPLNEIPAVGEISNRNKNNNFSRQAPDNKNINGNKLNPNSNLNMMKKKINTVTKPPAQYEPFNGNDQLADYKPFNPPSKPMLTGPKNNTINNSNNKNEDYENDEAVRSDKYDTLDYKFNNALENTLDNNLDNTLDNSYFKQFSSLAPFLSKEKKKEEVVKNEELLEKLNYMIHLLEEQQDTKTGIVGEEIILYSFLGIFIIFVIDSFARAAKYVR